MIIRNGQFVDEAQAVLPVHNTEFSYGFGVYENIKVRNRVCFFENEHIDRLLASAEIIGLEHPFLKESLLEWISTLVHEEQKESYNIKILLIGAPSREKAGLYLFSSNPVFPKTPDYRDGVKTISVVSERFLPKAKTLNMLESYLAYRKAKAAGAYDSLFVNREGHAIEGTRTNLFGITGKKIVSAPSDRFLDGVTRKHVLEVAAKNGFSYEEKLFSVEDLLAMDGAFLTSTSTNIVPIASIDEKPFSNPVPAALVELMRVFNAFLEEYKQQKAATAAIQR